MAKSYPITAETVHRSVIERKLLAALDDDSGKVAIVATQDDLNLLINALESCPGGESERMAADLRRLLKEAFGTE